MSISLARRKRTALYLSIAGLMLVVAAISAISARDPDGVTIRTGMILVTVGAAMWLPWQALLPVTLAVWLGPNFGRNAVEGYEMFGVNMLAELPGLLGLAAMSTIARISLRDLEQEDVMLGMNRDSAGMDSITGVFEESQLRTSLEMELSRSRRFGRTFALVLVGIDEMRQRFDYRDEAVWQASFAATADLLRGTRANVDRVYRYGPAGFAMLLPESGPKDVNGLVRRLRRVARKVKPQEGEPGGPLPAHYGATFFPTCATTVDDLIRRAEIALRISDNNASRVQLDGAEAPEMPPVETLRHAREDSEAEVPDETAAEAMESPGTLRLRVVEQWADEEAAWKPASARDVTAGDAAMPSGSTEKPEPALAGIEAPGDAQPWTERSVPSINESMQTESPEPAPAPLHAVESAQLAAVDANYSDHPDAVEVDEEPPFEVFAYRAPEPAVDAYSNSWQTEAPLSVIHRPHLVRRVVARKPAPSETETPSEDVLNDALKQLDGTLELIRALKQRTA